MVMNTYSKPWFLHICICYVYEYCVHTHTIRVFKKKAICFPPSFWHVTFSLFKQTYVMPQGGLWLLKGKEVIYCSASKLKIDFLFFSICNKTTVLGRIFSVFKQL